MSEPDPTAGLLGHLRRWAADQEVAELARSRSRAHWLRQQALESATLAGVLLDLAERRAIVTVETVGRAHNGRLLAVSTGLCCLDGIVEEEHRVALVALPAITMVRRPDDTPDGLETLGDRTPELRLDLAGALAGLAGDRPRVCLELHSGKRVTGVLESVGVDVIGLRVDGEVGAVAQLAVNAICACLL